MTDLWTHLKQSGKPIVLYGIGNGADKVIARLERDGIKISGVFSSSGFKKNKIYAGHTVCDYGSLKSKFGDMIILVCFGSDREDVLENIITLSKENELYFPDVPVYTDDIFDLDFAREHKEKLETVYNTLADEMSRKVFKNTVLFKLNGRIDYLLDIETPKNEVYSLLNLTDNEYYLDLGAYNGDTVLEFIENYKQNCYIKAVEPDARNYRKLCENVADIENLTAINAAVCDYDGHILISSQHGRGINTKNGDTEIPCKTIDCLCADFPATLIKMDVEGNEVSALNGGENTIKKLMPKLLVACYHTSYDIFEIPLKIKSIAPEYKIYMRHQRCLPAWDTNYVFVK